jgi:C1A family cysteine protease
MRFNKPIKIEMSSVMATVDLSITSLISIVDIYKVAAIAVHSVDYRFVNYQSGVIRECGDGPVDHAVTLVGYVIDHKEGVYAWIVKNSWGMKWGMGGYTYISM